MICSVKTVSGCTFTGVGHVIKGWDVGVNGI